MQKPGIAHADGTSLGDACPWTGRRQDDQDPAGFGYTVYSFAETSIMSFVDHHSQRQALGMQGCSGTHSLLHPNSLSGLCQDQEQCASIQDA